jgi:hypothetical protein
MLKSVTGISLDAEALIRSYHSWAEGALQSFTDTRNGPKNLIELRNCQSNAKAYAQRAREILSREGSAGLDPLVTEDLTAIAEELEAGIAEIDQIADPDIVWSKLDRSRKEDVTQRIPAEPTDVDGIRARLHGKMRGLAIPARPGT